MLSAEDPPPDLVIKPDSVMRLHMLSVIHDFHRIKMTIVSNMSDQTGSFNANNFLMGKKKRPTHF